MIPEVFIFANVWRRLFKLKIEPSIRHVSWIKRVWTVRVPVSSCSQGDGVTLGRWPG